MVELNRVTKNEVIGDIVKREKKDAETLIRIVIGQGIPKGNKMDMIIQKATELGVSVLVPIKTERMIVRIESQQGAKKIERWRRIAREAARQSVRRTIPEISEEIIDIQRFCTLYHRCNLKLILWEEEKEKGLREVLNRDSISIPMDIAVIIGPEGGFSKEEIKIAKEFSFIPTGLGSNILSTETVALTILSIIQFRFGNIG
jgi:16S rRNA (uracil1498-N3)-methyltransferase